MLEISAPKGLTTGAQIKHQHHANESHSSPTTHDTETRNCRRIFNESQYRIEASNAFGQPPYMTRQVSHWPTPRSVPPYPNGCCCALHKKGALVTQSTCKVENNTRCCSNQVVWEASTGSVTIPTPVRSDRELWTYVRRWNWNPEASLSAHVPSETPTEIGVFNITFLIRWMRIQSGATGEAVCLSVPSEKVFDRVSLGGHRNQGR